METVRRGRASSGARHPSPAPTAKRPRGHWLVGAALLLVPFAGVAAKPLSDNAREAIARRLERVLEPSPSLTLEEGDTVFLETTVELPGRRLQVSSDDLELLVLTVSGAAGLSAHPRADRFRLEPTGTGHRLRFRYAIHAEPGTRTGGTLKLRLNLVERRGLGNSVHQLSLRHDIEVAPASPSITELASDFLGYRYYRALAARKLASLKKVGLSGLTLDDQGPLPALDTMSPKLLGHVLEFDRLRRRLWIAHRHLTAGSKVREPETANAAKSYLATLDVPDSELTGLPKLYLDLAAPQADNVGRAPSRIQPATSDGTKLSGVSSASGDDTLEPIASYESDSDADEPEASSRERPKPVPKPMVAVPPEAAPHPEHEVLVEEDSPFAGRTRRRVSVIPTYFRPLLLDDPNVSHSIGVRFNYARVRIRESALAAAFFYFGQLALTRDLSLEFTVPTQLVDLDVDRARTLYALGNPLVAAKYRLHLPEIGTRRPALSLRLRWGLPIAPQHRIPPTNFSAEDFTREAYFADTYAFFLEKTSFGGNASLAWAHEWLTVNFQLGVDYFVPVKGAVDSARFTALTYGASLGAQPFGPWVGFFAEARATSLFSGPGRTELFTYLGARGRLPGGFEPALWVALPAGSVSEVSGIQLGIELRFAYDLAAQRDAKRTHHDEVLQ